MVSLDLTRLPVLMVSECIPNCGLLVYKVPSIYGEEEKELHSNCLHRKLRLKERKMDLKLKGNVKCTNGRPLLLNFFLNKHSLDAASLKRSWLLADEKYL